MSVSVLELNIENVMDLKFDAKRYFSLNVLEEAKSVLCCGFQIELGKDRDIGCDEMKK